MTDKQVAEQIEVIKLAGAKARVSKEATIAFLTRAGIIEHLTPLVADAGLQTPGPVDSPKTSVSPTNANGKKKHQSPTLSSAKNKAK